jgi:putative restriction endonuclease
MEDPKSNKIRLEAFNWLAKMVAIHGDVLSRELLAKGFEFDGTRIPLVNPAGIFKPKGIIHYPLTITSIPGGIYPDKLSEHNLIYYRYRGTDPHHRDNVGLRDAMRDHIPLIYLHRVTHSLYLVHYNIYKLRCSLHSRN